MLHRHTMWKAFCRCLTEKHTIMEMNKCSITTHSTIAVFVYACKKTRGTLNHTNKRPHGYWNKVHYTPDDVMHRRLIRTIYRRMTLEKRACPDFGSHWETIGFQGNDPGTDLNRSMGIFSLIQVCLSRSNFRNRLFQSNFRRRYREVSPRHSLRALKTHSQVSSTHRLIDRLTNQNQSWININRSFIYSKHSPSLPQSSVELPRQI